MVSLETTAMVAAAHHSCFAISRAWSQFCRIRHLFVTSENAGAALSAALPLVRPQTERPEAG
jgi:hypothetical protein